MLHHFVAQGNKHRVPDHTPYNVVYRYYQSIGKLEPFKCRGIATNSDSLYGEFDVCQHVEVKDIASPELEGRLL